MCVNRGPYNFYFHLLAFYSQGIVIFHRVSLHQTPVAIQEMKFDTSVLYFECGQNGLSMHIRKIRLSYGRPNNTIDFCNSSILKSDGNSFTYDETIHHDCHQSFGIWQQATLCHQWRQKWLGFAVKGTPTAMFTSLEAINNFSLLNWYDRKGLPRRGYSNKNTQYTHLSCQWCHNY